MLSYRFLGLPEPLADIERAGIVILPVAYDATASYRAGTREGPARIIEASRYLEWYDEETETEVYRLGIATHPELEPVATGPEAMVEEVYRAVSGILASGQFPVILGGEHTVSLGAIRAAIETTPNLVVLQLDAHADLRDTYQGSSFSHACVMARVAEICPFIQVGLRSLSREEALWLKKRGLRPYWAREVVGRGEEVARQIVSQVAGRPLYVTIDCDVFDPAIMPAVGTPEPGGLSWFEVITILRSVSQTTQIVGFDVVELAPIAGQVAPDFLAARLVYKFLSYIFSRSLRSEA
ncbi:agmatinase [Thermosulfuriphilus ammonigenes]|uniref:Agmatinase n=1 Tax=Thermosulfuriphilus ammonigenes TaxID=1936021 RepID=A0A6G7PTD2_9BACT|nr:agmatinase [Thermosulfuriphilus ammonigenes]MBA2848946.1 agmatinase [Thermosulfuriphilus ammonigenes]QIJ70939.1 agmatinase [Thermosulfuriphilus ammonigenes]